MSNRNQTGGGLIYRGTNAVAPPNCTFNRRDPTIYDSKDVSLLDLWLNEISESVFILVSLAGTSTSKGTLATWVRVTQGATGDVTSLTGDFGIQVGPTAGGTININGTNPISIIGNPAGNQLQVEIQTATTTQIGATTLASNALTIGGVDTTHAVTPAALQAKIGTETLDGVAYGGGPTAAIDWTAAGTNGQVLIGATGAPPAFATITSSTLTITPGPNSLDIEIGGGTSFMVTTTDATPTALATFAIPTNQAITLIAEIIGAKADYSAAIGGEATATARRAAGALAMVGSPIIDLNTDSGGAPDFNVVVSSNNLVLQVTGEAATTYNWKALVRTVTV